jgi:alkylated DNA repair dioxygenase AlkB
MTDSFVTSAHQGTLRGLADLPEGFRYQPNLIDAATELSVIKELQRLEFLPFQFHGFEGKRLIVSFGWRYDFNGGGLQKTEEFPGFLIPLRDAAAAIFRLEGSALQQALLIEYGPGASIGWHKDRPVFGDVVGISLLSPCTFRFRRKAGTKWERRSIKAQPGSAYLLQGPSRNEWEHSIPAVSEQRYSITFRSLRDTERRDSTSSSTE